MTGPKGKDPAGGFNGEIVVDTGNTAGLLVPQGYSTLLENRKPSKMRCTSASGDRMQIGEDGELPIHVTTEGGHVNFDLPLKLDCTTSAELGSSSAYTNFLPPGITIFYGDQNRGAGAKLFHILKELMPLTK